jgi:NAD(P)-dependent dehydrogenase (short-subunit alcohol dehydrogenase family)
MPVNPMDLAGRTILVTGASSGIGRETATLLSQLNARVVLAARDAERLEQTRAGLLGEEHRVETFDLNAVQEIPGWVKTLAAACGPFDGIAHCAGIHDMRPLNTMRAERFEDVMRTNVTSGVMLAKGFRQNGCFRRGGGIVFLSSVAGLVGQAGVSAYAAGKAALAGLTRSLAVELAPQGIRVNCVAPGLVDSEMTTRLRNSLSPEQFAAVEALHPLGLGTTRDVAHAVAFLLAETGRWITGSTLVVDGGYTAH